MVRFPKISDDFFKNIFNINSYKTRFTDNQNYFVERVCTNSEKKVFLIDGLHSGKIKQCVYKSCLVTFCKHKDCLLNYE